LIAPPFVMLPRSLRQTSERVAVTVAVDAVNARLVHETGLTPRHRESDTKVVRGRITKMGSRLVRWAALEAVARYHGGTRLQRDFRRIADRRGKNKARVAVARKLLTLVYYGLRDGEIRCVADSQAA